MRRWDEAFHAPGPGGRAGSPDSADLADRERLNNARDALAALLDAGAVPIINENDTVATEEIRFGDNDALSAMVVPLIGCDLLVPPHGCGGCSTGRACKSRDGGRPTGAHPSRKLGPHRLGRHHQQGGVGAARQPLGGERGHRPASHPAIITELVSGADVGTLFPRVGLPLRARKHWIAFTLRPRGTLILDDGAVKARSPAGKHGLYRSACSVFAANSTRVMPFDWSPSTALENRPWLDSPRGARRRSLGRKKRRRARERLWQRRRRRGRRAQGRSRRSALERRRAGRRDCDETIELDAARCREIDHLARDQSPYRSESSETGFEKVLLRPSHTLVVCRNFRRRRLSGVESTLQQPMAAGRSGMVPTIRCGRGFVFRHICLSISALTLLAASTSGCARFAKRAKSSEGVAQPAAFREAEEREEPDVQPFALAQDDDFIVRVVAGSVTCSGDSHRGKPGPYRSPLRGPARKERRDVEPRRAARNGARRARW